MALYTKDNIEAFVLTYNRRDMLKEAVTSLLNQTIGNINVTVMDNCSTDDTEDVIKEMQKEYPNLHYHKNPVNEGQRTNFNNAVNLAEKDYVIMLHDDDIIHPDYLKYALAAINKTPNTAVVSSFYKEWTHPDNLNWKHAHTSFNYCPNKQIFADYLYRMQNFCYSNTVYKTSNLRDYIKLNESLDSFGKIADKPFVLKTMKDNDGAVILRDKNLIRYRVHPGQDTASSGPFYDEIITYNKFFKHYMQKSAYSMFMYNLINYKQLKNAYIWGKDNTLSLNEFVQKAVDEGAGCFWTEKCINPKFGKIFIETAHILRKIFKTQYKYVPKV